MMGFGSAGPMSWIFGALAMVTIWGGVWWMLSALVFHWPNRESPASTQRPPLPPEPSQSWQQPPFAEPSVGTVPDRTVGDHQPAAGSGTSTHLPSPNPESEFR